MGTTLGPFYEKLRHIWLNNLPRIIPTTIPTTYLPKLGPTDSNGPSYHFKASKFKPSHCFLVMYYISSFQLTSPDCAYSLCIHKISHEHLF